MCVYLDPGVAFSPLRDGRARAAVVTRRSASRHAARHATLAALAVELHHDRVADAFQSLLLGIVPVLLGGLVGVEPPGAAVLLLV